MDQSSNQNQGGAPKKQNRGGRGQKKYRGNKRGGNNYYNNNFSNNNRYSPQYQIYPQQHQGQYYNPYFQQQMLYRTEMYICSKYRNLIDINQKNAKLVENINSNCKFFVIK